MWRRWVRGRAWFLGTLLLPPDCTKQTVKQIFTDLQDACQALGVTLIGGHTEVTDGVKRPILAGTLLGEVAKDRLVVNANAQPGDVILLTNGVAIEGTAILAQDASEEHCGPRRSAGHNRPCASISR